MEMWRWQQELTESIQGMEEDLSEIPAEVSASILQYFCLENPMDRGAWQVIAHRVARVGHDLATKPPPPAPCTVSCSPRNAPSTSFHCGKEVSQRSLIFLCNKTSFLQFFSVASDHTFIALTPQGYIRLWALALWFLPSCPEVLPTSRRPLTLITGV